LPALNVFIDKAHDNLFLYQLWCHNMSLIIQLGRATIKSPFDQFIILEERLIIIFLLHKK